MASLVAKKKANQIYSTSSIAPASMANPASSIKPISELPRVAALVKDRTAPLPLAATAVDFGLPGALWLAAQSRRPLHSVPVAVAATPLGPSPSSLPAAGSHPSDPRPGPKTEVAAWYDRTILRSPVGFPCGAL